MKSTIADMTKSLSEKEGVLMQAQHDLMAKESIEKSLEKQILALKQQVSLNLEQLPERQVEIIKVEEDRLKSWGRRLEDQEVKVGIKEADLAQKAARASEIAKAEANEEKARAMAEVEDARTALRRAAKESEKSRLASVASISKAAAEVEGKDRILRGDRAAFEAQLMKFREDKLKWEIDKSVLEPRMNQLEEGRAGLEETRKAVELKEKELEAKGATIRRGEIALRDRERELEVREHKVSERESGIRLEHKELEKRAAMLQAELTNLQEARLRVHEQQIAVAKEVAEVKRALLALKLLEGRAGLDKRKSQGALTTWSENLPMPATAAGRDDIEVRAIGASLKSINGLESAIERCSSSLDELTLRSRAAVGDISVPLQATSEVIAGAGNFLRYGRKEGEVEGAAAKVERRMAGVMAAWEGKASTTTREATPAAAADSKNQTIREILGPHSSKAFSQKAGLAARRLKQASLESGAVNSLISIN